MARGRPPKAPELRIADGTHRKDRHGAIQAYGAEVLLNTVPEVPRSKGAVFKKCWREYCERLIQVGQFSARDIKPLESLCDAHQDEADTRLILKVQGEYFPTMAGIARHPAWATLEKLRKFIQDAQLNFGFSPAGRAKVPATVQSGKKSTGLQSLNRKA